MIHINIYFLKFHFSLLERMINKKHESRIDTFSKLVFLSTTEISISRHISIGKEILNRICTGRSRFLKWIVTHHTVYTFIYF